MTPGERLKKIRTQRGLSQEDLEAKTGINRTNLSGYENNRTGIGVDVSEKLAKALGVEPSEILFGSRHEPSTFIPSDEISDEEKLLLKKWRALLPSSRGTVETLLDQLPKKKNADNADYHDTSKRRVGAKGGA